MHVVIAGLYGFTFWLATLAAAIMLHWDWVLVLLLGPIIVSGAMVFLWVADWAIWRTWAWLVRTVGTLRAAKTDS